MRLVDRLLNWLPSGSREAPAEAEARAPTEEDGAQRAESRSAQPTGRSVAVVWNNGATVGGVQITNESASRIAAYASCVNVLSQDLAKLPAVVLEQREGMKRLAVEHRAHQLLAYRPNPMQTPYQFKQFLWRSVLYRGNGFAQIMKDQLKRPIALYPLHPDAVRVRRVQEGDYLVKVYDVATTGGKVVTLPADEVLHIMGDSEDGIAGNSPIKQHALAFGWAFVMAEFGAKFFENGAHASIVVTLPEEIETGDDGEKEEKFRAQFEKRQGGVENAGKPIYVGKGGDVKTISVTPEQSQYLDSRKFSRSEIAGILRVPSHKIGDNADMKYSNAEMQEQAYKNDGLLPWAVQFEEEALVKLFTEEERSRYVVRYDFNGLLRADRKSRAEAHKLELQSGEKTLNEIRAENDDPPVEGGNVNLVMTSMTTYQAMEKNGWRPMKAAESPVTPTET